MLNIPFIDGFSKILDNHDVKFHQCRLKIIDFITSKSNISGARVVLSISQGIILYDVSFTMVYFSAGQMYKVDPLAKFKFAAIDLPHYLLKMMKDNRVEVKFDESDLQTLYEDCKYEVINRISYNEILEICKSKSIAKIRMIDRVFYIRVENLDADENNKVIGHFGKIENIPTDVSDALYPFKECTLQL